MKCVFGKTKFGPVMFGFRHRRLGTSFGSFGAAHVDFGGELAVELGQALVDRGDLAREEILHAELASEPGLDESDSTDADPPEVAAGTPADVATELNEES